jgi:O-antigen/teichoic acid export membrane protein
LVLFALLVVNMVLGPMIASLHAVGDQARLQWVITASARAVIAISLPVALTMIFFGSTVLSMFGGQFTRGASALAILATAQLFNAATGSVVLLLNMTGHERITAQVVALTAALNILLNALLIPRWDVDGAAVATGVSLAVLNTTLMVRVHRKLGIDPTALGRISFAGRPM